MKKILLVMLIISSIFYVNAAEEGHEHNTPEYQHKANWSNSLLEAFKNIEGDKNILVEFGKFWCNGYKSFAPETLESEEFLNYAKENLELVSIDPRKAENLVKKYNITVVPTYVILNKYGKELDRITGYSSTSKFIRSLDESAKSSNNFYSLKEKSSKGNIDVDGLYLLGKKYYERGLNEDSVKTLKQAVLKDISFSDAYILLGNISLDEKKYKVADTYYKKALKYSKSSDKVWFQMGLAAYKAREHKKSMEDFAKFIQVVEKNNIKNKNHFAAYYYYVLSAVFDKNFDKADSYLKVVQEKFPNEKKNIGSLKIFVFTEKQKISDAESDEHFHEGCGSEVE